MVLLIKGGRNSSFKTNKKGVVHKDSPQKLDCSFSCFSRAVCTCYLVLIAVVL